MKRRLEDIDEVCIARFAVIEEKLETIIAELNKIGKIVPYTIIEHTERIEVLGRNFRTIQWLGGVIAVAIIGAFIGHIFGM
jgi:hypothetical protein